MDEGLKDKVERMKAKAELFIKEDIKAFIVDTDDTYYFCDILLVGDNHIMFQDFTGKRKGEKTRLLWLDVQDIEEYKKDWGKMEVDKQEELELGFKKIKGEE